MVEHEKTHEYGCTLNKQSYSLGNDTWSEMGKHCNATKKVYCETSGSQANTHFSLEVIFKHSEE